MVRPRVVLFALAVSATIATRPAPAGAISFTGNSAADFDPAKFSDPRLVKSVGDPVGDVSAPWLASRGLTSGWDIQRISVYYDNASDTAYVGVDFVGVAGDSDGDGNPDAASAAAITAGGTDRSGLAGNETISVAFGYDSPAGPENPANPLIVAGVPSYKSKSTDGLDQFTVAKVVPFPGNLGGRYGEAIPELKGTYTRPSGTAPDFEFTIQNFSKAVDPKRALWVQAFAGSNEDILSGEEYVRGRLGVLAPQVVPEPAAVLAWGATALGAVVLVRRRRRAG